MKMRAGKNTHERSEHWYTRNGQFTREADKILPGRIVFLGDSITEGFSLDYFFPDLQALNRGISGDHTDGLLQRLHHSVIRLQPSKLFVLIGINDIGAGDQDSSIVDNYLQLMQQMAKQIPGTTIFIQSILPTSRNRPNCPKQKINHLNTVIREYAEQFAFKWIDLHSLFKNKEGYLKKDLTDDGLHLNGAGYLLWAKALTPYLY